MAQCCSAWWLQGDAQVRQQKIRMLAVAGILSWLASAQGSILAGGVDMQQEAALWVQGTSGNHF